MPWALYAITGGQAEYGRILAQVEAGRELGREDLDTFASGCERFPKARAVMEKAFLAGTKLDSNDESVWLDALRTCLGRQATDDKLAYLDKRRRNPVYEAGL